MTKSFLRDLEAARETRDAAHAVGRRPGKRVGDWLDDVIPARAEADTRRLPDDDEDEFDEDQRRFARPRGTARPAREGRRWLEGGVIRREAARDERDDDRARARDARTEPPRPIRLREAPARQERDSPGEAHGLDAEAIVGDAVKMFERRAAESDRRTERALAELAELIERNQARPRVGDELGSVIDRLGRIEKRMAQPAETANARPIRSALARLESRIERLSREDRALELESALVGLDRRLTEIAERLDREPAERRARPAPPEPERRPQAKARGPLADAIAEITERQRALDEQSDAGDRPFAGARSPRAPSPAAFGELHDSIEAISHRLETVRHEATERGARQSLVARQVDRLREELEGVSRALVDLAPRASVAAVEAALRDLADRVETQRSFGVRENVLAPVERLTADLQAIIRELDPSRIVHDLYDEVRTIGEKLAARPVDGGADQAVLDDLASQTREIRDLLQGVAARPLPLEKLEAGLATLTNRVDELSLAGQGARGSGDVGELVTAIRSIVTTETYGTFEAFERKLEGLAGKIDAVLAKSGGGKRFDEINERIDRLHKSLSARLDRGGAAVDTSQLEHLVTKLAKKIDSALDPSTAHAGFDELGRKIEKLEERLSPRAQAAPADAEPFRELAQRIDFVHSELAARIEDGSKARADGSVAQLADLVGQLAKKIDAALDPRADRAAFSALERQIGRLSDRLDRSDESIASFASIERTIGELFDRIDDSRSSAAQAAELAARQAAQDVLREAAAPGALQSALEKELTDLRNNQDESGQRTHETLEAVHETLERVVDRLAVFEDELAELRKAPPRVHPRGEGKSAASAAPDLDDVLLEPGSRRPARREPPAAPEPERSVQADFIAAARRAAQQAALDARTAAIAHDGKVAAAEKRKEKDVATPQPKEARSFGAAIQARKRPLLLGLGALVMLIGAYQIARVSIDATNTSAPSARNERGDASAPTSGPQPQSDVATGAPAQTKETPRAPAAQEPAATQAAPQSGAAPVSQPFAKFPISPPGTPGAGFTPPPASPAAGKAGSEAVDPTPVGAIGPAANNFGSARQDVVAAIRELAAAGDRAAQFELAVRYIEGKGAARDAKAAFQWFEKAAGQGLAPAQYRLGSLYEKGIGVERDYAQARSWYQRAARAGNARAMHNLAVLYAEGGDGKPDYVTAAEWFQKAAELGVRDSQFNLAILYARGLGVGQSMTKSYLWFSAAAAQGDDDAGKKRDEVGARLDSKELAAAKALVDGFKPKQPDRESNDVLPPPGGWENVKAPAKPETKPAGKPKISYL